MSTSRLIDDFTRPGPVYRAISFWALNGELRRDELRRQLDVFKQMGLGGACLHSRSGLVTRYLSTEWFRLMADCVEHARRCGILIWLYDEDRYPSGAAGGIVTRDPAHRQKRLWMQLLAPGERPLREDAIAWFAMRGSLRRPRSVRRIASPADRAGSESLLGFHVQHPPLNTWYNGYTYLDAMSPDAVAAFIRSTYEPYRQKMQRHFGRTIEGIFTDEPNRGPYLSGFWGDFLQGYKNVELMEIPWTGELPRLFRRRFEFDLLDHLPELYLDLPVPRAARTRFAYFDLTSELLSRSFGEQVGRWCRRHGTQLVGHVQGEESPSMQTNLVGSAMRFYTHMDMPGIDVLTEKCRDYDAAIQCASVARQAGRRWVVSETHGATGWDLPLEAHKAIADWQMALGVNRRCLHLSFYTMAGAAKRDYPASIHFQSAWWKHYAALEDYHARLAAVLSRGEPANRLLVINPLESTWLHAGIGWMQRPEVARLDQRMAQLRDWLLEAHIGFDYGEEALLGRLGRIRQRPAGAALQVGKAEYSAVLVPQMETIRSSTLRLLRGFRDAGGRVVWVQPAPALVDALPCDDARRELRSSSAARCSRGAVLRALHGLSAIEIAPEKAGRRILAHVRRDGGRHYLMLCNTDREAGTGRLAVSIAAEGAVQEWDPGTGERFEVPAARQRRQRQIETDIPRCGTRLFVLGTDLPKVTAVRPAWRQVRQEKLPRTGWQFELSEPNPLVLDWVSIRRPGKRWTEPLEVLKADAWLRGELGWRPRTYHVMQPWAAPKGRDAAPVEVRAVFNLETSAVSGDIELALEHLPGLRRARMNGRPIDLSRDRGWWVDPCFHRHRLPPRWLRQGENEIVLEIDYGPQAGLEAMYLLSAYGVRAGTKRSALVPPPRVLRMGDLACQGLPHYSAAVTYQRSIRPGVLPGESVFLCLEQWSGCCAAVRLDGRQVGELLWPPYDIRLPVKPGAEHELGIEVILGRGNTFGPLHYRGDWPDWISPQLWESQGANWQDRYRLRPMGLLSPPSLSYRQAT